MNKGFVIPILSPLWVVSFFGCILFIVSILFIPFYFRERGRNVVRKLVAITLLADALFSVFYYMHLGVLDIRFGLPLSYCGTMGFFGAVALITKWRFCYETSLFLGIIAPFQAIVAPAINIAGDLYLFFEFFISHALIVIAPIYLTLHYRMRPSKGSWWKSVLYFLPVAIFMMVFDYFTEANYMFLMEKPDVEHFLNTGDWPFYLVKWATLLTITSFLISQVFTLIVKKPLDARSLDHLKEKS